MYLAMPDSIDNAMSLSCDFVSDKRFQTAQCPCDQAIQVFFPNAATRDGASPARITGGGVILCSPAVASAGGKWL